jgi:hypothetical protein
LLTIQQKKGTQTLIREVEPYALYPAKAGTLILESRLVAGDYEKTPPPHWCPLPLDEIISVTIQDHVFQPDATYKANSSRYKQAICRV